MINYDFRTNENVQVTLFPDGQRLVSILNEDFDKSKEHRISLRINSFDDFSVLMQAVSFLNSKGIEPTLYIPYMFGARSDRKFDNSQVNYMRDVVGNMFNNMKTGKIYSIDPHSHVTEAVIRQFEPDVETFSKFYHNMFKQYEHENVTILFPDAGAQKKAKFVEEIAKQYVNSTSLYARKVRNESTGEITDVVIDGMSHNLLNQTVIIIDDICDGGWTFIKLFQEVDKLFKLYTDNDKNCDKHSLKLCVTHGIFSKGLAPLVCRFDKIHTTDSIKDRDSTMYLDVFHV